MRDLTIKPYFIKYLKLRGTELLVYADIFAHSESNPYFFSPNDFAVNTGIDKQTICVAIQSLIDKGLLKETEFGYQAGEIVVGGGNSLESQLQPKSQTELGKPNKLFVKPTIEEIEAYINEKKLVYVNAEQFYDFYESKGWVVGKAKMKNYRAALSGWNSRAKDKIQQASSKKFNDGDRDLDKQEFNQLSEEEIDNITM